ncbi:hypothetical protein [Sphingobium sp.]|uniref:hypothetical protein n=1 Tax=Sphingobium sp. TaxID=1912891 RepID=UPI002C81E5F8|nr:hypothetical protein [Sphingobium sp.]HUD94722.1 hypothetical protein [Sphingobium sp.]
MKLHYGKISEFAEAMAKIVKIVTENAGWELHEALQQVNERLHTFHHIWKMRDMNHFLEGSSTLKAHPE